MKNLFLVHKSRKVLFFLISTITAVMMILFQNCSSGYQSMTSGDSNNPSLINNQDLVPMCDDGDQQSGYIFESVVYPITCGASVTKTCVNGQWSRPETLYPNCRQQCLHPDNNQAVDAGTTYFSFSINQGATQGTCDAARVTSTCSASTGTFLPAPSANKTCLVQGQTCAYTTGTGRATPTGNMTGSSVTGFSLQSATYPTLCGAQVTRSCQASGQWTGTTPLYTSCVQRCVHPDTNQPMDSGTSYIYYTRQNGTQAECDAARMTSSCQAVTGVLNPAVGAINYPSCAVIHDSQNQSMAAGAGFTCWTDDQSLVQCTGHNSFGKLGNGTNVNSLVPVKVSNLSNVRRISLGYEHACAIDNQSRTWCWGRNHFGQLGNNSNVDSYEPVLVLNLPPAKEISAGEAYTCAVDFQGQAHCWGQNTYGQLGNNSMVNSLVPVPVSNLSGALNISTTSGGTGSTCALTATQVLCWGDNRTGQLGNNSIVSSLVPVPVQNITSPRQIGSGYGHHCVLDGQSRVWCWGRNIYGQLGNGTIIDSRVPVAVTGLSDVKQLNVKYAQSCVIDSQDRVLCWGSRGALDATVSLFSVPSIVPGLSGIGQVVVGFAYACAVDSQKRVYCWGSNSRGEFGNNTIFNAVTPIQVR